MEHREARFSGTVTVISPEDQVDTQFHSQGLHRKEQVTHKKDGRTRRYAHKIIVSLRSKVGRRRRRRSSNRKTEGATTSIARVQGSPWGFRIAELYEQMSNLVSVGQTRATAAISVQRAFFRDYNSGRARKEALRPADAQTMQRDLIDYHNRKSIS